MIIRRLHIDNFGRFHDFDLEFAPGLNRIAGPNEFGKTTLLEFLRRLFWGFPDRRRKQLNPYPALSGSGFYGGFLEVTLRDGREFRLERRGAKGDLKIMTPGGEVVKVCADVGELSGVSENFYRNVCAITIDELTAFAALDDEEVRSRLYGGALSLGSVSLSELQKTLDKNSREIWRNQGNSLLKSLAGEFAESEKRLAEASEALPAYEKTVRQAEELERSAEKMKNELAVLKHRAVALEKRAAALGKAAALEADEGKFAARPRPEGVPAPLPPFGEKPPEPPAEPAFPERLAPPPAPDMSDLDGKCDWRRAAPVTEEYLQRTGLWASLICELEKCVNNIKVVGWTFLSAVCLGVAAGAGHAASWLLPDRIFPGVSLLVCAALAVVGAVLSLRPQLRWVKAFRALPEARRFRDDLLFRFSLAPQLENREIPGVLSRLKQVQEEQALYEEAVKKCALREQEIEALRQAYEVRRKVYDESCAAFNRRRAEYDRKHAEFEALCRARSVELAAWEAEKQALALRRKELDALLAETGRDPVTPEELASLRQRCGELGAALEETLRRSGAERREAALLMAGRDCAVEVNVREQIRGRMRSAAENALILAAAEAVLEKAVERCEKERQPELLNRASGYFAGFTNGNYTRIYKQLSSGFLRVSGPGEGSDRAVEALSRGTREQLFLALRLALILSLDGDSEPLPVVLDDVLVDFDPERRSAVRGELARFAADRQVIMFECDAAE